MWLILWSKRHMGRNPPGPGFGSSKFPPSDTIVYPESFLSYIYNHYCFLLFNWDLPQEILSFKKTIIKHKTAKQSRWFYLFSVIPCMTVRLSDFNCLVLWTINGPFHDRDINKVRVWNHCGCESRTSTEEQQEFLFVLEDRSLENVIKNNIKAAAVVFIISLIKDFAFHVHSYFFLNVFVREWTQNKKKSAALKCHL